MKNYITYSLVLFPTTMEAFAFNERAKLMGLEGRLIPVPRELSASCGMCWRENKENLDRLEMCLKEAKDCTLIKTWN